MCRKPPKIVQQNAVFLINLRYTSLEDLRADGLPQYDKYGGKGTLTVEVDDADADDMKVVVTRRAKGQSRSEEQQRILFAKVISQCCKFECF